MSELLEKIPDKRSMNEEYKKVRANKGAGGVDGMEIEELAGYISKNCTVSESKSERSYTTPNKKRPVRYNVIRQINRNLIRHFIYQFLSLLSGSTGILNEGTYADYSKLLKIIC